MTNIVWSSIGSGTVEQTRAILSPLQRGSEPNGQGLRGGIQVMIGNPEDMLAVDTFAASGIAVGATAVEIIGPHRNLLPRCRQITLQNTGAQAVYISHRPDFPTLDAFEIPPTGVVGASNSITLSVLHNVSIYAKTASSSSVIRLLTL